MTYKITSISITKELYEWVQQHPNINLSSKCQEKIMELIEEENKTLPQKENIALREKIAWFIKELRKHCEFLEQNKLMETYLTWEAENKNVLEQKK